MMEYRVRTKRSKDWINRYKGAQVLPEMINLKLQGPSRVFRPDGKPLAVYLPGAALNLADQLFGEFSTIRMKTDNRGLASGMERVARRAGSKWTRTDSINSAIIGSFDRSPQKPVCRLTAFNAREVEHWTRLLPMFKKIGELLAENVPERYALQVQAAQKTHPDWIIRDTPFTTITVNNTYPTGIHTDKGDLDEGFSTLTVMRRGNFTGGWLTFPQYGISADLQHGDVLLMDAHDWHGNTPLLCGYCQESLREPDHRCDDMPENEPSPERVSIVSYFRTDMTSCGSMEEENERWEAFRQERNEKALGVTA